MTVADILHLNPLEESDTNHSLPCIPYKLIYELYDMNQVSIEENVKGPEFNPVVSSLFHSTDHVAESLSAYEA